MRKGAALLILCASLFCSCKKSLTSLYEIAEIVTISKNGDTCKLGSITVKNLNEAEEIYALTYTVPLSGKTKSYSFQNKVTNASLTVTRTFLNDSISIIDGDSVFVDSATQLVKKIVTRKNPLRFKNDINEYRFTYKDSLLIKKVGYVNGDTVPYFSSTYTHDPVTHQLTKVQFRFEPENRLLFESTITYDSVYKVVPWIYLYTDFFSLSEHQLMFNFGRRATMLPTSIKSVFYEEDGVKKLGTWETLFSAYKISKDRYVLNFNCSGQRLESLPYLYQNVQFTYQCP
ncbi:MAG: hypothetical protein RL732_549 [Bacteroidota bacterium]